MVSPTEWLIRREWLDRTRPTKIEHKAKKKKKKEKEEEEEGLK